MRSKEDETSRGQERSWRVGVPQRDQFQQLQALDEAIAWRRARSCAAGLILALTTVNGK